MSEQEKKADATGTKELGYKLIDVLSDLLDDDPSGQVLGVTRQLLKDLGVLSEIAAEVAQDPKGPVARGVGRVLPFAKDADAPQGDELAG